ncbi:MAG TPA: hypothetical protein PLE88_10100 [Anaerohalosphaeraceae bacterium]|nr:hypothetical protein [Anaerohalosphaeraceae bacterium]
MISQEEKENLKVYRMENERKIDNLIHLRAAARRFGLPPKWLKEQAISGAIPALIADNKVLFDLEVLVQWLTKRARGTGDDGK